MTEEIVKYALDDVWAVVDITGHKQEAGRISIDQTFGMFRIDVPVDNNGNYRTVLLGQNAIHSVNPVSEDIARSYANPRPALSEYREPIVSRSDHDEVVRGKNNEIHRLQSKVHELERRLTNVEDKKELPQSRPVLDDDGEEIPF